MKKLEEIMQLAQENGDFAKIVKNCDIVSNTLTISEKIACIAINEIAVAVNDDCHKIVFDCNFKQSRQTALKVDYARVVDSQKNNSVLQLYAHCNTKKIVFDICFSCKKADIALYNSDIAKELNICVAFDKKTSRAKTAYLKGVDYVNIVDTIKKLLALLASDEK